MATPAGRAIGLLLRAGGLGEVKKVIGTEVSAPYSNPICSSLPGKHRGDDLPQRIRRSMNTSARSPVFLFALATAIPARTRFIPAGTIAAGAGIERRWKNWT